MNFFTRFLAATVILSTPAFAADLIANKRMDSVFFGLVKPGLDNARTADDYIEGADCKATSEIYNKTFSGSGYLKIPAATRELKPMKIVCTYNGRTKKFEIESDKVFLANPVHRAIIMRGSRIKDPEQNAAFVRKQKEKLKYWGYGNSIIVNF